MGFVGDLAAIGMAVGLVTMSNSQALQNLTQKSVGIGLH